MALGASTILGSRIVKVDPRPGSLSTVMSPPIIWQKRRLIASPSPVPPYLLAVDEEACENSWNSWRAQLMAHIGKELRLVLARLRELAALVLNLIEQPRVLDRDHRLVGEGRHQLDLLVGEKLNRATHQHEDRDRDSFAQERRAKHGTRTDFSYGIAQGVVRIVQNIGDLDDFARKRRSSGHRASARFEPDRFHKFMVIGRHAVAGGMLIRGTFQPMDRGYVGFAQPRRRLDQCIEHRLEVEGRAADGLEHVGGGGLLLERFASCE